MTTRVLFFVVMCVLGGVGGLAGSIVGAFTGRWGLFIGGLLGGVGIAPLSARIAMWCGWIGQHQYRPTTIGAALGFVASAAAAVALLRSPLEIFGALLSTLLTGAGALYGASRANRPRAERE